MCDKNNYKDATGFRELDKDYFELSTDPTKTLDCQARALKFIAEVETICYNFLEYSKDYNTATDKEAVTKSLQNITIILHHKVNTFLNTYAYSGAFNVSYIELRQKVKKVIVRDCPDLIQLDLTGLRNLEKLTLKNSKWDNIKGIRDCIRLKR